MNLSGVIVVVIVDAVGQPADPRAGPPARQRARGAVGRPVLLRPADPVAAYALRPRPARGPGAGEVQGGAPPGGQPGSRVPRRAGREAERPQPQVARAEARRAALAAKRRRTLLALSAAFVLCLALAVWSGGRWWLTLGISTVLLVMYVTHLRTEAQQLAAIERRRAQARRRARPVRREPAGRPSLRARRAEAPVEPSRGRGRRRRQLGAGARHPADVRDQAGRPAAHRRPADRFVVRRRRDGAARRALRLQSLRWLGRLRPDERRRTARAGRRGRGAARRSTASTTSSNAGGLSTTEAW